MEARHKPLQRTNGYPSGGLCTLPFQHSEHAGFAIEAQFLLSVSFDQQSHSIYRSTIETHMAS